MKLFFQNFQAYQFIKLRNLVYENLKSQYSGSDLVSFGPKFSQLCKCIYAMLFIFIFRIEPEVCRVGLFTFFFWPSSILFYKVYCC